jgi:hypothetical protein
MLQRIICAAVLTGVMSLSCMTGFSQKCKYVKETTDAFTNEKIATANMAIGMGLAGREVLLQKRNDKFLLGMRITSSDLGDIPFKAGDKISFKLANNDLVEVAAKEDLPAMPVVFLGATFMQWIVLVEVDKATFEKMAASPIVAIKFKLKMDGMIPEIKEKQTRKIMETAACMLGQQIADQ